MAKIFNIDFREGFIGPGGSDVGGFHYFEFPEVSGRASASVDTGYGRDGGYGLKIQTDSREVNQDDVTSIVGYDKRTLADLEVESHPARPKDGDEWWYSFSFKIGGTAWPKAKGYEPIIWQAASIDEGYGTNTSYNTQIPLLYFSIDDPGTAPLALSDWYRSSTTPKLLLTYRNQTNIGTSLADYNNYAKYSHYSFGTLAFNTWYDVKLRVKWSAYGSGLIESWLKNESQNHFNNYPHILTQHIQNIPLIGSNKGQAYIKFGYEASLNFTSSLDYMRSILYFDNLIGGNAEEDVDLYPSDGSVIAHKNFIYPYELVSESEVNTPTVKGGQFTASTYVLKNAPTGEQLNPLYIAPGTANQILTTINGATQWSGTGLISDALNTYIGSVDTNAQTRDLNINYLFSDSMSEGIVGTASFLVSQRGAGANMSVDVSPGTAWIKGDGNVYFPQYRIVGLGTTNVLVSTADVTNPRNDIVYAQVGTANNYSGLQGTWSFGTLSGTPAVSPGTPTAPSNSIVLAVINIPANDTTIGSAQITDKRPLAQVGGAVPTSGFVTSLPTNPYDGQLIYYLADSTNGVVWHFRYNASSASSYKWEFVGGASLHTFTEGAAESTSSSTFTTLTTATEITVPLAGTYLFEYSFEGYSATVGRLLVMAVQIGSEAFTTAEHDFKGARVSTETANSGVVGFGMRKADVTSASTVCRLMFKILGGNTGIFQLRNLKITPVRVG